MAVGDRKVKIQEVNIQSGNPVRFVATWQFSVEDNLGADRVITGGVTEGSFGTMAQFNVKTGLQLRQDARAAVLADARVPPNNDVS